MNQDQDSIQDPNPDFHPMFSILHPTIRTPVGWIPSFEAWLAACDRPENVEYLLTIDTLADRVQAIVAHAEWDLSPHTHLFGDVRVLRNNGRKCYVDAQNYAARKSKGAILITSSDDWYPCPHWDTEILRALGNDPFQPAVVNVDNGHHPHLIIYPIMTRAYYTQPGRGGCGGEFFYPEYISMGSDDDLTEYARRDGVVIDTPLKFEHKHPWRGDTTHDTHGAYKHVQSLEAWQRKDLVLPRRRDCGFSR